MLVKFSSVLFLNFFFFFWVGGGGGGFFSSFLNIFLIKRYHLFANFIPPLAYKLYSTMELMLEGGCVCVCVCVCARARARVRVRAGGRVRVCVFLKMYIYEPVTKGRDLKWDTLP